LLESIRVDLCNELVNSVIFVIIYLIKFENSKACLIHLQIFVHVIILTFGMHDP
jgi:hypothetical protein